MGKLLTLSLVLLCIAWRIDCAFYNEPDELLGFYDTDDIELGQEEETQLNIHIINHSHDDVGWLKTVDDYYYGDKDYIQKAGVQYIIDSVVDNLLQDPQRRFIFVEVAFFFKWWHEQSEERKQQVRQLVANGQFEFINGGWCMNDEATCYYEDIIDQMTIGHQFLLQNFNILPSIGWQIDPFGHSASQASLFSQMGFNGWFFARIDYQDKKKRLSKQDMETIMRPLQYSGDDTYIFTHVLYHGYGAPNNFCFDVRCSSQVPIMDDPSLEGQNVRDRADQFMKYFRKMSKYYKSNHLMHTFGSDFHYMNAYQWYINLDRLIKYINNHQNLYHAQIMYSTPSLYLKAINAQKSIQFGKKTDDFFPYADHPHAYWTGYFTSRVAEKGQVRDTNRYLQSTRTYLSALKYYNLSKYMNENEEMFFRTLDLLEQSMGVNQHHDGLTGTEKQHVADDYSFLLSNATQYYNSFLLQVLKEQSQADIRETTDFYHYNWNQSYDEWQVVYKQLAQLKPVLLSIYNPGPGMAKTLQIKIPKVFLDVIDIANNLLDADIICANSSNSGNCDLYFNAQLQSYSLNYFKLVPNSIPPKTTIVQPQTIPFFYLYKSFKLSETQTLKIHKLSDKLEYTFCASGSAQGASCETKNFQLHFNYYVPSQINTQVSGAYIFRPNILDTHHHSKKYQSVKSKEIYIGKVVSVLHLEGKHMDTQLKFFKTSDSVVQRSIEVQNHIKPIPVELAGKEIVVIYEFSGIDNQKTWYTDSNGLEMQERKYNHRPTWDLKVHEPSAGNYYPVNIMMYIQDKSTQERVAILTDRTEGATSLKKGQLEFMVHRRLLFDDHRGVGEALDEKNQYNKQGLEQKVRHWIVFSNSQELSQYPRQMQKYTDQAPVIFAGATANSKFVSAQQPKPVVPVTIPPFLKFYLRYMGKNQYLLRLHNMHEKDTINFSDSYHSINEFTLTANQLMSFWKLQQMKWNETTVAGLSSAAQSELNPEFGFPLSVDQGQSVGQANNLTNIPVKPMQIKTFIVTPLGTASE